MSKIDEKSLERYLNAWVNRCGGLCVKFSGPGSRGFPDRICLFTRGRVVFVEVKGTGEALRPNQRWWQRTLKRLGFDARVVDTKDKVLDLVEDYGRRRPRAGEK